jgi:hypothetical protein
MGDEIMELFKTKRKFNIKSICKKCHCKNIEANYKQFHDILGVEGRYMFLEGYGPPNIELFEVILRKCNRCGFEWLEMCNG